MTRNLAATGAFALALLAASAAHAATDADLAQIREEIRQMKASYEARIEALEQRLKDTEARTVAATPPSAAPQLAPPTVATERRKPQPPARRHEPPAASARSIPRSRRCCRVSTPTCRRIRIDMQSTASPPAEKSLLRSVDSPSASRSSPCRRTSTTRSSATSSSPSPPKTPSRSRKRMACSPRFRTGSPRRSDASCRPLAT